MKDCYNFAAFYLEALKFLSKTSRHHLYQTLRPERLICGQGKRESKQLYERKWWWQSTLICLCFLCNSSLYRTSSLTSSFTWEKKSQDATRWLLNLCQGGIVDCSQLIGGGLERRQHRLETASRRVRAQLLADPQVHLRVQVDCVNLFVSEDLCRVLLHESGLPGHVCQLLCCHQARLHVLCGTKLSPSAFDRHLPWGAKCLQDPSHLIYNVEAIMLLSPKVVAEVDCHH